MPITPPHDRYLCRKTIHLQNTIAVGCQFRPSAHAMAPDTILWL